VPALLNDIGVSGDAAFIIFGAALIHALMTAPRGIAGQLADVFGRLTARGGQR
jgi:branched-chain amino acid transport system permease protein